MEAGTQLEPVRMSQRHPEAYYNISDTERKVSLAVGAASLAYGLSRGGPIGWTAGVTGGFLAQRGLTGHCYANQVLGRNSARATQHRLARSGPQRFTTQLTIARRPEELFRFWRDFTRLPTFMRFITEVRPVGGNRTHWVAEGPWAEWTGRLEWDAEVTDEVPNERIAWRSVEGSDVDQRGEIRFRATEHRGSARSRLHAPRGTAQRRTRPIHEHLEQGGGARGSAPVQAVDGDRRDLDQ